MSIQQSAVPQSPIIPSADSRMLDSECVIWPGTIHSGGYGMVMVRVVPELTLELQIRVHRVAYAWKHKIHPFSPEMPEVVRHMLSLIHI